MIAEGLERDTRSFVPTASTFDWWSENVQNEVAESAGGDGWREIIGVRSIDSSLAVRARGRRQDAKTQRGFSFRPHGHRSIHSSIHPPTSQHILTAGRVSLGEAASSKTDP